MAMGWDESWVEAVRSSDEPSDSRDTRREGNAELSKTVTNSSPRAGFNPFTRTEKLKGSPALSRPVLFGRAMSNSRVGVARRVSAAEDTGGAQRKTLIMQRTEEMTDALKKLFLGKIRAPQ
jgi:hypothetical protein